MALTKADLTERLVGELGLGRSEAKLLVEAFFEEIRSVLARGEPVKLSGFGSFEVRDKVERPGRNPKTGEEIPVAARRVVTFHSGMKLKNQVQRMMEARGGATEDLGLTPIKVGKRS